MKHKEFKRELATELFWKDTYVCEKCGGKQTYDQLTAKYFYEHGEQGYKLHCRFCGDYACSVMRIID